MNNARATWFPIVCTALNCEYGQLGTGGQGMVRPIEIPPLPQTWDHYDVATSRLSDGKPLPEPDYSSAEWAPTTTIRRNKSLIPIGEAYLAWLVSVREVMPERGHLLRRAAAGLARQGNRRRRRCPQQSR